MPFVFTPSSLKATVASNSTVEPAFRGHPRDQAKVSLYDRCPLVREGEVPLIRITHQLNQNHSHHHTTTPPHHHTTTPPHHHTTTPPHHHTTTPPHHHTTTPPHHHTTTPPHHHTTTPPHHHTTTPPHHHTTTPQIQKKQLQLNYIFIAASLSDKKNRRSSSA